MSFLIWKDMCMSKGTKRSDKKCGLGFWAAIASDFVCKIKIGNKRETTI